METYELLARRVELLARFFVNRQLCFEIEEANDSRHPQPITGSIDVAALLQAHITNTASSVPHARGKGKRVSAIAYTRLGAYTPMVDELTKWLCIDFDGGHLHGHPLLDARASALAYLARLQTAQIPAYLERSKSGAGWHVWVLFESPVPARDARRLALSLFHPEEHPLVDGTLAIPNKKGVDIFPKMDRITAKGWGTPVYLPWWGGAKRGNCQFYRQTVGGEWRVDPLPTFQPYPYEALLTYLATLPVPAEPVTVGPHPYTPAYTRPRTEIEAVVADDWRAWRERVCDAIDLRAVYGDWLTGRTVQAGMYLECRDRRAGRSDRNPSASVRNTAPGRGAFHSFISGDTYSLFDMLVEVGMARNFRDACGVAERLTGIAHPAPTKPIPKRLVLLETPAPSPPPGIDQESVRAKLVLFAREEMPKLIARATQQVIVLAASTGAGKTHALASAIRDGLYGEKRVLYLTPTWTVLCEIAGRYFSTTGEVARDEHGHATPPAPDALLPDVAIAFPRSPHEEAVGYCHHATLAHELAARRHQIPSVLCPACRQQRATDIVDAWEASGDRNFAQPGDREFAIAMQMRDLPDCPYLANRKRCDGYFDKETSTRVDGARVVLANHAAYLHAGDALQPYDVIVIDEGAEASLVETVVITQHDVLRWQQQAEQHSPEFLRVLAPVCKVLLQAFTAGIFSGVTRGTDLGLLSVLRRIDPEIDAHLRRLWMLIGEMQHRHTHATPADDALTELGAMRESPLRALADLIEQLAAPPPDFDPLATCLHVTLPHDVRMKDGTLETAPGKITMMLPRYALADTLTRRTTVVLDATPNEAFYQFMFSRLELRNEYRARRLIHTTLFYDALYRKESLGRGWRRAAVERFLERICAEHASPLVVTPKRLNPGVSENTGRAPLGIPANARVTHHGAADVRGSNQYQGCDALVVIGHHRQPDQHYLWLARALRRKPGLRREEVLQHGMSEESSEREDGALVPIAGFATEAGRGLAAISSYPLDPLATRMIQSKYSADLLQTIGRIRPGVLRADGQPARVYLLTGVPANDLPIDSLTSLLEWMTAHDPSWLATHPAPSALGGVRRDFITSKDAHNRRLAERKYRACLDAAQRLLARGEVVSKRKLAAEAGTSESTAHKYLRRICAELQVDRGDAPLDYSPSYNNTYIYLEHAEYPRGASPALQVTPPRQLHLSATALARLLETIQIMQSSGQPLTQRSLKAAGGFSEHTIAKYADVIHVAKTLGASQYTPDAGHLSGGSYPPAFHAIAQWGEQLLASPSATDDRELHEAIQLVTAELAPWWPLSRAALGLIVDSYHAACPPSASSEGVRDE
jgi:hypothetical protein